ncbi:hypothetical protein [Janthinobacterium sp. B9-8]|uniref:hypothetical protein n=1 Tax=Janthinobacterium sp. B9-8 TaxID=1236179 RepID=UPI00061D0EB9|nr:hypothetical protein [Janthinobacterium sp. B9-8]AMC35966.1 hypothetical protein VN23_15865 [Janthinobacterium sp. B9-8]
MPIIFTPARIIFTVICLLCTSAALAFFIIMQEKEQDGHWPWPVNGVLINQYSQATQVWDDDHRFYTIPAHTRSGNELDVDHAFEPASRRWCKIGPHTVTLKTDGYFKNCPCFALDAGRACIQF